MTETARQLDDAPVWLEAEAAASRLGPAVQLVGTREAAARTVSQTARVLVVRCCRLPQFERALCRVRAEYPDAELWALSTSDYAPKLRELGIDRVVSHRRRLRVTLFQLGLIRHLRMLRFDTVVVPYMDADGFGYSNVHRFVQAIAASNYVMIPAIGEPLRFNRSSFRPYAAGTIARYLRHRLDLPLMLASLVVAALWPHKRSAAIVDNGAPRRVLHIISSLGTGGAQVQLGELVSRSREHGYIPEVLVLNRYDGDFSRRHIPADVPVTYLEMWPLMFCSVREMFEHCKRRNYDVVHTWLFFANFLGAAAARLAGTKRIVSSVRNMSVWKRTWYRRWWFRLADSLAARSADVITVNASALVPDHASWALMRPSRIVVVHNGLSVSKVVPGTDGAYAWLRAECGFDPETPVMGTVGRLAPEKNQETFLRLFARMHARRPSLRAVIAGDGELRVKLERLAAELGIASVLRLLGTRPDSRRLIAGLDLFVLPSTIEGFPNVLLEAVMLGVPSIASAVGGAADVLDGHHALFRPDDLERAILLADTAFDDIAGARSRAESLRLRALERFSAERMAARWCSIYDASFMVTGLER